MKPRWWTVVVAALMLGVAVPVHPAAGGAPPQEGSGPTVEVSPSTDLVDGQTVTITGTGFPPGQTDLWAEVCAATGDTCSSYTISGTAISTDATGAFSVPLTVRTALFDPTDPPVDCRVASCRLFVEDGHDRTLASVPLSFRPDGPLLHDPQVTLSADSGLVDGQLLHLNGSGWRPHARLTIIECDAGRRLCPGSYLEDVRTDDAGAFAVDYRVRSNGDRLRRGPLDCRTEPCFLRVTEDHNEVELPLAFDPDAPPAPPPTVRITPDHDLVDGQEISVEGSGYFPGQELVYGQCTSSTYLNPAYCQGGHVTADADGDISFSTTVKTTVYPDHGPIHFVSCHPHGCFLGIAVELEWYMIASTRVGLVPDGDARVTVTPASGLHDGDTVSIDATGLNVGTSVEIAQCVVGDLDYRNIPYGQCTAQPRRVAVDAAGEIHTILRVSDRFIAAYSDPPASFDCRVDVCQVIVGGEGVNYLPYEGADYSWLGEPLSFATDAPPTEPATPAATPRFAG